MVVEVGDVVVDGEIGFQVNLIERSYSSDQFVLGLVWPTMEE